MKAIKNITLSAGVVLLLVSCNNQETLVEGKGELPHPDSEQSEYLEEQKRSVNPPTEPEKRYKEKQEESKESKMSPY